MTVWLNGRLLPASEAQVDPDDRGLLLGDGLVETMLSLGGTPVEFDAHWARLAASAALPSSEHLREKGRDARARPWATGPPGGGAGAEKV